MKISLFFVILLSITFSLVNGQFLSSYQEVEIKKIIFDDLIHLNNVFDKCLIQPSQGKLIVREKDTLFIDNTLTSIKDSFNKIISIVNIDVDYSIGNFYEIEVKFHLLCGFPHLGVFRNNTFKFVVYESGGVFYRINGFFISDILLIGNYYSSRDVRKGARIRGRSLFFHKHLKYRNTDKMRNYLTISVVEGLNRMSGYRYSTKPYVRESICNTGF